MQALFLPLVGVVLGFLVTFFSLPRTIALPVSECVL